MKWTTICKMWGFFFILKSPLTGIFRTNYLQQISGGGSAVFRVTLLFVFLKGPLGGGVQSISDGV